MSDTSTGTFNMSFGPTNPRGICSVCGDEAYDGRATKCAEHSTNKRAKLTAPKFDPGPATFKVETPPTPPKEAGAKSDKDRRADQLKLSILNDLNPQLPQVWAFACQPIPKENFYTLDASGATQPTQLGSVVQFTEGQANILGKALAELEKSPIASSVTAMAGPMMPYLYGIGALVIVAMHGAKLYSLRGEMLRQWQVQMEAQAPVETPAPEPTPETVSEPYLGDVPTVSDAA